MRRIVVGIDGSEHAADALRFAVEEARLRNAEIDAVHAWHVEVTAWIVPLDYAYPGLSPEDLTAQARAQLEVAIADVVPDETGLKINRIVANGLPGQVLSAMADGAEMLVVGARGMGGFKGMLLGSVSHFLVKHAPCPLVIVKHPRSIVEAEPRDRDYVALT